MEFVIALIKSNILYILAGAGILWLATFLIAISALIRVKKLKKRYDFFMGTNRRPEYSLEQMIREYADDVKDVKEKYGNLVRIIEDLDRNVKGCVQKVAVVRYNPFDEMGGNLCFAVAVLDGQDNGVVINGIYGRMGSFTYAKPVEMGVSTYVLSKEEIEAIEKAKESAYTPSNHNIDYEKKIKVYKVRFDAEKLRRIQQKKVKIASETEFTEEALAESEEIIKDEKLDEVGELAEDEELDENEEIIKDEELDENEEIIKDEELDESKEIIKDEELDEVGELAEDGELDESGELTEDGELDESGELTEDGKLDEVEGIPEDRKLDEAGKIMEQKGRAEAETEEKERFAEETILKQNEHAQEDDEWEDEPEEWENEEALKTIVKNMMINNNESKK